MRIAVLIVVSALVAGCSSTAGHQSGRSLTPVTTPSQSSSSVPSRAPTTTSPIPTTPPAAGAPIGQVIAWVEAATPAEASSFGSATREGRTTALGAGDVAFTGPAGTPNCMTDARFGGALACLVDLSDPPARPADTYGQWKGGWVDFAGPTADIGSSHGDPGRFAAGTGAELTPGRSLAFGEYRCRAGGSDVYCVDYARQTGLKFAATGIEGFGCLRPAAPPEGIGRHLAC